MKRIFEKIAAFFVAIFRTVVQAAKAFFDIKSDDDVASGSKKVAITAARRVVYVFLDYWAAFACASIVGFLNYWELSFWLIVMATWLFDFVVATAFLVASEKSGHDITLGEAFRRAVDAIRSNSKVAGWGALVYINAKAVIWDGPEQVVIFFKKEIGSMLGMVGVLVFLTFFQGLFWAVVYSLGYETVSELVKNFF